MAMVCASGDGGCLTRGFDKIFEDAQLSGVLQLHGRNLKCLPPHVHLYDLSDTVLADISGNRLLDFPVELKQCGFLETLQLQKNCIRNVPNFVGSLTSLTFLDLSFNQIQRLPVALFTLPLEILLVRSSRLEAIPNEIEQLAGTLTELNVSCNKLMTVPGQIGALSKLRVFNARHNLLTWLPYEFCQLRLRHCDVSFNRLTHVEADLRLMVTLIELNLDGNPMQFPLAKVCARGRDHIFQALEAQYQHSRRCARSGSSATSGQQRLSAGDLEQRLKTRPALLPTNPSDIRYLSSSSSGRQAEGGAKVRNSRTVGGGDSGYSTLNDENAKIEFQTYRNRHLPPAGAAFFNDTVSHETAGSLVDEVMLACMEKVTIGGVADPVETPAANDPQKVTPRSVKSRLIQELYTGGGAAKAKDYGVDGAAAMPEIPDDFENANNEDGQRTSRRLFYSKTPNPGSPSLVSSKMQKLQRRTSLKNGSVPPEAWTKSAADSICSILEGRLNVSLPRDDDSLVELLSDGVLMCEYLNDLRPRTVTVVHAPIDNVAKIPTVKARRNVENFLTGCRKLGVAEDVLPSYDFILHQSVELKALSRLLEALTNITTVHEANASSPMLTLRQHMVAYGLIILLISYIFRLLNICC